MLEGLVLNGVDLNDGATLSVTEVSFTPAQARPQWSENPNADGAALVAEPHYSDAIFDLAIRVKPASTAAVAFERLGEVVDAVQSCARIEGGAPLEWTPKDTESAYIAYAKLGEISEIPTDQEGWLLRSPVIKIRLTCRPFLYTEEVVALEATESGAEPQQVVYVLVEGDVPAEARLVVTEKSTQDRRYFEWGHDIVSSEEGNPSTLLTAASLSTTGFSGEAKTRTGAYDEEEVKRAVAVSQPTTMCGTGVIAHVGTYRVLARVYAASEAARFRISYRNGEGPLVPLQFKEVPVIENFSQIDLGEVSFDEVSLGTQKAEVRVEVKSATGEPIEVDLNYLRLVPTTNGWGRARGLASASPNKLLAYDTFLQAEGALSGKTLPVGGTWSGAGDVTDFSVIAADDVARRTAVSDSALDNGRYALAGSTEQTTAKVSVDIDASGTKFAVGEARRGVLLRYTDTSNWLVAFVEPLSAGGGDANCVTRVRKRVAGVESDLGAALVNFGQHDAVTVSLAVDDTGVWRAWTYAPGTTEPGPVDEGWDSDLALGGALAEGKAGIYDVQTSGSAATRDYDNFNLLTGEGAGRACYSSRKAEINSEGFTRQDSTGVYYGQTSNYRGALFYLQPDGGEGRINRVVVAMRRNDVTEEADANVTDEQSLEVLVRARYLAPR